MLVQLCMAVQPLPGDGHIGPAPIRDVLAAIAQLGFDVDPLFTNIAQVAESLDLALLGSSKFVDYECLGGSQSNRGITPG